MRAVRKEEDLQNKRCGDTSSVMASPCHLLLEEKAYTSSDTLRVPPSPQGEGLIGALHPKRLLLEEKLSAVRLTDEV